MDTKYYQFNGNEGNDESLTKVLYTNGLKLVLIISSYSI